MNVLRKATARVANLVFESTLRAASEGRYGKVRIANMRDDDGHFARVMKQAMTWIQELSPRHYERIQANLRWIANSRLADGGGRYEHRWNICLLEAPRIGDFLFDYAETARVIVHEATHAWLMTRGIPYTRKNVLRVERLCLREENRFLKKLDAAEPGLGAALVRDDFDPSAYEKLWSLSRRERFMRDLRLVSKRDRPD